MDTGQAGGDDGGGESVSTALARHIRAAIAQAGGWLPFDRFMHLALYTPGLGYYAHGGLKFGLMPGSGSDFVTAPQLSALFGQALAAQVRQALVASGSTHVLEFGAGSGALAEQLLLALGDALNSYAIVELTAELRTRQQARLARFGARVQWLDGWPEVIDGMVLGNEVLDAMPVQLLHWDGRQWWERGVAVADVETHATFAFADRPTALRPPVEGPFIPGTLTEIHPQAEAFIASLAQRLRRGAALFIDYGFPAAEYYHPQRLGGTLMCHRAHRTDADALADVGLKDITAHVDFTGIALAAQDAGLDVAGYTSQGRFLINCGIAALLQQADVRQRALAQKLITEHEMGELFKVLLLTRGCSFEPIGFALGDRSHRL